MMSRTEKIAVGLGLVATAGFAYLLSRRRGLGTPDYSSGWTYIPSGGSVTLTHNLGTTRVLLIAFEGSGTRLFYNRYLMGYPNWVDVKENTVEIYTEIGGTFWVFMWKWGPTDGLLPHGGD